MGNATNNFIEPILSVIPSPKTDNLTGMIASYAKVLNEFSDEALELAADHDNPDDEIQIHAAAG